jgi:hypothetical protein
VGSHQVVHPVLAEEAGVARLQDSREDRMNVHENARLTPHGRERIVRQVSSGQRPDDSPNHNLRAVEREAAQKLGQRVMDALNVSKQSVPAKNRSILRAYRPYMTKSKTAYGFWVKPDTAATKIAPSNHPNTATPAKIKI